MQRRSVSHKRLEAVHQLSAKCASAKNEWGENFIMDRYLSITNQIKVSAHD